MLQPLLKMLRSDASPIVRTKALLALSALVRHSDTGLAAFTEAGTPQGQKLPVGLVRVRCLCPGTLITHGVPSSTATALPSDCIHCCQHTVSLSRTMWPISVWAVGIYPYTAFVHRSA